MYTYTVMSYIAMANIVIAYIAMAHIAMGHVVRAYVVVAAAYIAMAYRFTTHIVMDRIPELFVCVQDFFEYRWFVLPSTARDGLPPYARLLWYVRFPADSSVLVHEPAPRSRPI